jgi:hypothetical protein
MRIRALAVVALSTLPIALAAQVVRPPRTGRTVPPTSAQPAKPDPQIPVVARELAYRRSRWTGEAYSLITTVQTPTVAGGSTRYTTSGSGTRGSYRYTDHWSATVDMTASFLGDPSFTETGEIGTRYSPLTFDHDIRPFFDLRAAYVHSYDTYLAPAGAVLSGSSGLIEIGRYTSGFGSVMGAGFEYSLTRSLGLTTELSAMRNRMTAYRQTGVTGLPSGSTYWATPVRLTIGLRFNPVRTLHLDQNPMK